MLSLLLAIFIAGFVEDAPKTLPYAPQHLRFSHKGMITPDGQEYATLTPYVALPFGVTQLEGAKHRESEVITCLPVLVPKGDVNYGKMEFSCDDGSLWGVVGVAFNRKGEQ